jgi:hypothetical protein
VSTLAAVGLVAIGVPSVMMIRSAETYNNSQRTTVLNSNGYAFLPRSGDSATLAKATVIS